MRHWFILFDDRLGRTRGNYEAITRQYIRGNFLSYLNLNSFQFENVGCVVVCDILNNGIVNSAASASATVHE